MSWLVGVAVTYSFFLLLTAIFGTVAVVTPLWLTNDNDTVLGVITCKLCVCVVLPRFLFDVLCLGSGPCLSYPTSSFAAACMSPLCLLSSRVW